MSHLFGRRYLSRVYTSRTNLAILTKRYPSIVVLPPLPDAARNALVEHEGEILRIFVGYALSYATAHAADLGLDCQLPLSGLRYCGASDDSNAGSLFQNHLRETSISVAARSQFVATSGHTDSFRSVRELARSARQGLHLNEHVIPSMAQITARDHGPDLEFALNAYLVDFYTHGQVDSLAAANGIRRGDLWYLLQDFALTLTTIKTALEQLFKASGGVSSEADLEDENLDAADPAEMDREDLTGNGDPEVSQSSPDLMIPRPSGVSDADWRVYEVVSGAHAEFDVKYRAMWA